jgi:hypothetical protein
MPSKDWFLGPCCKLATGGDDPPPEDECGFIGFDITHLEKIK